MKNVAPKAIAVQKAIDEVMRRDKGRLLSGLISRFDDFQLAEDALQDAVISALGHWARSGIPNVPTAWLMKVALNKGIDRIRAKSREAQKADNLGQISLDYAEPETPEQIPDERLRLIFTCCHPALEEKSRVALTLRTVCNLTTREIAAAFLDNEQTMGQRLTRAKAKIKSKGIAYAIPDRDQWADRLDTVLSTLYLIFTTGYVNEEDQARDLCREGIFLLRLLAQLQPEDPEIEGALALMLLTQARKPARVDAEGRNVPIEDQNDRLWQADQLNEGQAILQQAIARQHPGPFQIKAAIADCHMMRPTPDWVQMSLLYQTLWTFEPTPIVALNWAVVLAEIGHVDIAMQKLDQLAEQLEGFQPLHAARANMLAKLGRVDEARASYAQAIALAPNTASRLFLQHKYECLPGGER
ncbi:RNA polymerase sigma factor [Maritalea sp. S77]|uniref:RNA polymerase sigma factor n=1 Tax=Maritalea sp. S77 TaxID=3415125 RepID=UPI003C7A3E10